jgi:hypothetical protein
MEFLGFNANNEDFFNKENVEVFFKSSTNTWNYAVEKLNKGFRFIRFLSNGHVNKEGIKTKYLIDNS